MRIRTGYSFRNAVGHLPDVISRLQEIGWTSAPITDTASTFGFVKWRKYCTKAGLRPIYGVELAVTESLNQKKPVIDYWTFLALDSIKPLNDLIELATAQFHYTPRLTVDQAVAQEGVIRIVGHRTNLSIVPSSAHTFVGLGPSVARGYYNEAVAKDFAKP